MTECSHCKRPRRLVARGFCASCYERWRKTGSPEYKAKDRPTVCQLAGCGGRVVARGLCDKHRLRLSRHGTTDDPPQWGAVIRHPLKHTWKWITRHKAISGMAPEWERDFLQFAMDVGERPSPKHKLFAADDSKPIGPGNFVWKRSITEKVPGEDRRTYLNRAGRVYRAVRKEAFHGYELKKRYGVSAERYEEMLQSQDGGCAICGDKETATDGRGQLRNLCIDHCHATGQIRGLLCAACNRGVGYFRDDIERLRSAITYLKKHAAKKAS